MLTIIIYFITYFVFVSFLYFIVLCDHFMLWFVHCVCFILYVLVKIIQKIYDVGIGKAVMLLCAPGAFSIIISLIFLRTIGDDYIETSASCLDV